MFKSLKSNLVPTLLVIVGFLLLLIFRFTIVGFVVFFLMIITAFLLKAFDIYGYAEEAKKQKKAEELAARTAKTASLNKLRAEVNKAPDDITEKLRKIFRIGESLVNYESCGNETVAEILKAYKVYIDKYLEDAAVIAGKYRRTADYLKERDISSLRSEVETLSYRIAGGEKNLDRLLNEKKATLKRLDEMIEDQPDFLHALKEIHATLESLESSIKRAENNPDEGEEIRREIQQTISSVSQAMETVLNKSKK
jgi:septal ring factor EnvC (AmiA/AmiB activator)